MKSVPPRGSGWVSPTCRSSAPKPGPTCYRVVVLTSSRLLNSQWPQLCFLTSKRNEADRIFDPPRPENCFAFELLGCCRIRTSCQARLVSRRRILMQCSILYCLIDGRNCHRQKLLNLPGVAGANRPTQILYCGSQAAAIAPINLSARLALAHSLFS